MKPHSVIKNLALLCVIALLLAFPAQAGKRPFTPPAGTTVTDSSSTKDYTYWTIASPDYSAIAVVAKIKLPKAYHKTNAFRRYVGNSLEQAWESYGIGFKAQWKKGSYVVSGNSGDYRVYAKGRLKGAYWNQGWVVGPKGSAQTKALEKMIKKLK